MRDTDCIAFLQWALPRLEMRWPGYRKVRAQVCKRVDRRCQALGLAGVGAYRAYLEAHPDEWSMLDRLCAITISRFYRDTAVFDFLRAVVLPAIARDLCQAGGHTLHAWSIGCASGEEPYTLKLAWEFDVSARFPGLALDILASDIDENVLERARRACYPATSLKLLPAPWRELAFERRAQHLCLRPAWRSGVRFIEQDIGRALPDQRFQLILCRNLVFTYFDVPRQRAALTRIADRLVAGAVLVIGRREMLPDDEVGLEAWDAALGVYRKNR